MLRNFRIIVCPVFIERRARGHAGLLQLDTRLKVLAEGTEEGTALLAHDDSTYLLAQQARTTVRTLLDKLRVNIASTLAAFKRLPSCYEPGGHRVSSLTSVSKFAEMAGKLGGAS